MVGAVRRTMDVSATDCNSTARAPKSFVPGTATIRSASSHWTMTTIRSIGSPAMIRLAISGVAIA